MRYILIILFLFIVSYSYSQVGYMRAKEQQPITGLTGGFTGVLGSNDNAGWGVTDIGDVNGDGIDDIAMGARAASDGGSLTGALWICFMDTFGLVNGQQKISNTQGGLGSVLINGDYLGCDITGLGDVDGDGVPDIAVGLYGYDGATSDEGGVYILFLNSNGTVKSKQLIATGTGGFTGVLSTGDQFGFSVSNIGDMDGNGTDDIVAGAIFDDDGASAAGAIWTLFLNSSGNVIAHQKISSDSGGFSSTLILSERFGYGIDTLGDLDGDGVMDLAVGAIGHIETLAYQGAVYILYMNTDGTVKNYSYISNGVGGLPDILDYYDYFGSDIANIGDLDNNGVSDLAVGAYGDDDGASEAGAFYILFMNSDGTCSDNVKVGNNEGGFEAVLVGADWAGIRLSKAPNYWMRGTQAGLVVGVPGKSGIYGSNQGYIYTLGVEKLQTADGTVKSFEKIANATGGFTKALNDYAYLGNSCSGISDVNGDGIKDAIVGSIGNDNKGAGYFLNMRIDGTTSDQWEIEFGTFGFLEAGDVGDNLCADVANIGDLNNDGIEDMVIGATGDDDGNADAGAIYIMFNNTDSITSYQKISSTQGSFGTTLAANSLFGKGLAGIGDLDGDGNEDIAVGLTGDAGGGSNRGAIYILFMNTNGTVKSKQKIGDGIGGFTGTLDDDDYFGVNIGNLGDLDGDGVNDLAVGAYGDDDGGNNSGAVWILFMNTNGTVKSFQKISRSAGSFDGTIADDDNFGRAVEGIGDLNGDNIPDVCVGANFADDGGTSRGAIFNIFLNTNGTVLSSQRVSDTTGGFYATIDNSDQMGISIANMGDFDGDGYNDIMTGAQYDDDGGADRGATYFMFLNGTSAIPTPSANGAIIRIRNSNYVLKTRNGNILRIR